MRTSLFFQQSKIPTNNQFGRNHSDYSEDEDCFNQNQQQSNYKPLNNNWINFNQSDKIYQPDFFESYRGLEKTRQSKQIFFSKEKFGIK